MEGTSGGTLSYAKNQIERVLVTIADEIGNRYELGELLPGIYPLVKQYLLREGERVRPLLFCLCASGYTDRPLHGLFRAAASFEVLHAFILIHDNLIDQSERRRGLPTLHLMLNELARGGGHAEETGGDIAMVIGDMLFALGIELFLSVDAGGECRDRALRDILQTAFYAGSGEILELLLGEGDIEEIKFDEINRVYDLKTALYTFSCPLMSAAHIVGAPDEDAEALRRYGLCMGRAFQIHDDLIDVTADPADSGKGSFRDIRESKKTLLLRHAYVHADREGKRFIRELLSKESKNMSDCLRLRSLMNSCGTLLYAEEQIEHCLEEAAHILGGVSMCKQVQSSLHTYCENLVRP